MIFNLSLGFSDLENEDGSGATRTYALAVSDTVRVDEEKTVVMTDVTRTLSDVSYIFKDPVPEGEQAEDDAAAVRPTTILDSKTRGENKVFFYVYTTQAKKVHDVSSEQKRREHQQELARLKQAEGLARYENADETKTSDNKLTFKKYASYKKDAQLPLETRDGRVLVDRRNLSVLLPVYGIPVPFHVNTIKNVTKTEVWSDSANACLGS